MSTCVSTPHFAYVAGTLADGEQLPLCRLHYAGEVNSWGLALYQPRQHGYQDSLHLDGRFVGTAEDALDYACGIYLADPTVRRRPRPWTRFGRARTRCVIMKARGRRGVQKLS